MRSSTAYFAGAGTVIGAIAAGLGGGYLFFSIVSPHPEKQGSSEVSRLERRMSTEPIPATNKGAPEPVPYLDKPQISAAVADPQTQPQQASQPQQQQAAQPQPQQQQGTQQQQPQQAQPQQAPSQQASTQPAAAAPPAPPAAQPVAAADQPAAREKSATEDSYAKARDARREGREERRRAERDRRQQWSERQPWSERQQWSERPQSSERRKWRQRDDDGELVEVERRVREETEPRRFRDNSERPLFASEPGRLGMPRINLFGNDD
jgi:hypothetical protein